MSDRVSVLIDRARRVAILGELLESLPSTTERLDLINRMMAGGALSPESADILSEHYVRPENV